MSNSTATLQPVEQFNPTDTAFRAGTSNNSRQKNRQRLFHDLATFNLISSTASGANCFRSSRRGANGTPLYKTHSDNGVRASWGRQSCKSAFCPLCSTKRSNIAASELQVATEAHIARGGTALFLTLTAASQFSKTPQFQSAEYMFRRDSAAFTAFREQDNGLPTVGSAARLQTAVRAYGEEQAILTSSHDEWELNERFMALRATLSRTVLAGKAWVKDRKDYGVRGHVAVTEFVPTPATKKDGGHDWNYVKHNLHFHIVIFIDERLNDTQRDTFSNRISTRWTNSLKRKGYRATDAAQDFQWLAADDISKVTHYINKLPRELVTGKRAGKENTVSFWDALRDADGGRVDDDGFIVPANFAARNYFRQVEQVFHRKKLITYSTKFFEHMGVADVLVERAEEFKQKSIKETVLTFSQGTWQFMVETNPSFRHELLNMAENTETEYLLAFVAENGYNFTVPHTPTLNAVTDEDEGEYYLYGVETPF